MTSDPALPSPIGTPIATADIEPLNEAIVKGYPDPQDVAIRLWLKWGIRLGEFVRVDLPTRRFVAELLQWSESEGRTRELLAVLWSGKPQNPNLRSIAERLIGDQLAAIAARYEAPPTPDSIAPIVLTRANLQKEVTARSPLVGFTEFVARLDAIGSAICRIEVAGQAAGTGFLIGPHTVLTNYHVAQDALDNHLPGDQIVCRFDYLRDAVGEGGSGVPIAAAAGDAWRGPSSPFSHSDLTGTGSPVPGELDFAVISLAEPVSGRAPLILPATPPIVAPLDVAIVVQHPGGDPLQIAIGVVVELPATGLRYRYNTTTKAGSSGSPLFSADARLIGLHHAADPDRAPRYNQAVPIWRVARAIEAAGMPLDAL